MSRSNVVSEYEDVSFSSRELLQNRYNHRIGVENSGVGTSMIENVYGIFDCPLRWVDYHHLGLGITVEEPIVGHEPCKLMETGIFSSQRREI